MTREFSVVRELSRREVERHKKRFIGITTTTPVFKDVNGLLEWVCDVRVESVGQYDDGLAIPPGSWGIIKDVILAQWTLGLVADMNVPVLLERSESGRITVVARSEVRLPDISLQSYTFDELGFTFMHQLVDRGTEGWFDGFGYDMPDPQGSTGSAVAGTWVTELIPWGAGATDFKWGVTAWGATRSYWST